MDVITHVTDLLAFREEAKLLAGKTDELGRVLVPQLKYNADTDELTYGVTKIPVLYSGVESLTLIRIDSDAQLQYFDYMIRLGECIGGEYVFDSTEKQAEYERVRGDLNYTVDGEKFTKPYQIGVFL